MRDLRRLLRLYAPYRGWIALSIGLSLAATAANIGLLALSGWFITAMAAAGIAGQSMNYFTPAALIRLCAILRTGGRYADRVVSHETTFRLVAETRTWLFARLVPLAPGALEDLHSGDLLARLKSDIDRQELVFLRLVTPLASAIAALALVSLVLGRLDLRLALVVPSALLTIGVASPAGVAWRAAGAAGRSAQAGASLRKCLVDTLPGLAPLLAAGAQAWRMQKIHILFAELQGAERRVARIAALGKISVGVSVDLGMIVAAAIAIPLVRAGAISGPELVAALLMTMAMTEAMGGLPSAFADLPATLASARRIFAVADRVPVVQEPASPRSPPTRRNIVFEDVTLAYRTEGAPALANIDLTIPEGAQIGVVGASGAGKSSLIELLVRFRDPDSGEIRIEGVPLPEIMTDALRACFAVAPQRPHLFAASIADNLRIARPDATDADLLDAARCAGLGSLLDQLPKGLATEVGAAGASISGGEAKRVAIARALLVDAPIVILDEPGEGLAPNMERALLAGLLDRWAGRTVLLLTHSQIGLERMDRVLKLEAGRLAGQI